MIWTFPARVCSGLKSADSRAVRREARRTEAWLRTPAVRRAAGRRLRNAAMCGARGMPDTIRITGGSFWAHPQRGGFRTAAIAVTAITIVTAITATIGPRLANAAEAVPDGPSASLAYAYLGAFWQLDRHEIAALALTLGILCFAVVTAIMLVRTRRRLARPKPRRATRSSRPEAESRPRLRAACAPNRRSWWPGRPPTTSPRSSAIRRSSAAPSAAAGARLRHLARPRAGAGDGSVRSTPCARAARPSRSRSRRSPAGRSRPRATSSAAARSCGSRT